jgi:hypothetical protein
MKSALAGSLVVTALSLAAAPARAQDADAGTTTGGPLTGADFTFTLTDANGNVLDTNALASFLDSTQCACPTNLTATLTISSDGATKLGSSMLSANLMLGNDCTNTISTTCTAIGSPLTLDSSKLTTSSSISTSDVFASVTGSAACTALPSRPTRLWAMIYVDATAIDSPPSLALGVGGAPPAAPTGVTVVSADSGLLVTWTAPSDTSTIGGYQVLCSPAPAAAVAPAYTICANAIPPDRTGPFATLDPSLVCSGLVTGTSVRVHGLTNGTAYAIAVVSVASNGTPGAPSDAVAGTPAPTVGFDDLYKNSGGMAQGGCILGGGPPRPGAAAPLGVVAALGALALRGRRRRRSPPQSPRRARARRLARRLPRLLAAGLALAAVPARASAADDAPMSEGMWSSDFDTADATPPAGPSPRNWNVELRFGPYRPDVDSEFADRGEPARPFAQTFGTSRRLMSQLEIDRQLLHRGGTLALGLGAGYYRASAASLSADLMTRSGDETALRVIPLSVSIVFRADQLFPNRGIPFVPYAKAGLDCALWSISDTAKSSSMDGRTFGWHAAAGLAMTLGFLDPDSQRSLDQEAGVNDVAVFFELAHYGLDGLGSTPQLHLGDTTWFAGLMLEL